MVTGNSELNVKPLVVAAASSEQIGAKLYEESRKMLRSELV